jgi:hypothetical protein
LKIRKKADKVKPALHSGNAVIILTATPHGMINLAKEEYGGNK